MRGREHGHEVTFHVHIDMTAFDCGTTWLSTNLSEAWLRKPLGKALIEPLLRSITSSQGAEMVATKLTLENVRDVLVNEQPVAMSQIANSFGQPGDVVRVTVRLSRESRSVQCPVPYFPDISATHIVLSLLCVALIFVVGITLRRASSRAPDVQAETAQDESSCNMTSLDGPLTPTPQLVSQLAASSEPILIRQGIVGWQGLLSGLQEDHKAFPLKIARDKFRVNHASPAAYQTSLGEFSSGLRSGSIFKQDYVFNRVDNTTISSIIPELSELFALVSCSLSHDYCKLAPEAAHGTTHLAYGGDGSSNGWHSHGIALNVVLAGEKHWLVRNPSTGTLWSCWQTAGDIVWVPDNFPHSILDNRGVEVVALATQFVRPDMPALAQAAYAGLSAEVRALLRAGVAVDQKDGHGSRALHACANEGHAEIAAMLLDAGASAAKVDAREVPPLHLASRNGHTDIVRLLLKAKAPIDATRQADGSTALHNAAAIGHSEIVRVLIAAGAKVDARTSTGETALQLARQGIHHREVVLILQNAEAQILSSTVGWLEVKLPEQALWNSISRYYRHSFLPVLTFKNEIAGLGDPVTMEHIFR